MGGRAKQKGYCLPRQSRAGSAAGQTAPGAWAQDAGNTRQTARPPGQAPRDQASPDTEAQAQGARTHTHMHTATHMHAHTQHTTRMHAQTRAHMHTDAYMHAHVRTHTCTHSHMPRAHTLTLGAAKCGRRGRSARSPACGGPRARTAAKTRQPRGRHDAASQQRLHFSQTQLECGRHGHCADRPHRPARRLPRGPGAAAAAVKRVRARQKGRDAPPGAGAAATSRFLRRGPTPGLLCGAKTIRQIFGMRN